MTGSFRGFDTLLPTQLGKYRVDSVLGRGAMGIVYKGFDPDLQQPVAIKTIRQELLDDTEADTILKRFRNEAIAGRRLKHANIVSTYDYSAEAKNCFIVMEYVEGRRLKDVFAQQQRLSIDETLRLMEQLLDALDYAHRNGVVHRDINPGNLMFGDDGQLLIMDFGIAKLQASNLTLTMMVVGTPSYMSPEQCLGQPVDARTDIFSAGIVLYQLLTGEKPFQGDSLVTTMHQVVNKSPEQPSRLNAQVPRAFDRIVQKALAKNKDNRYQTAGDFARGLREAALRIKQSRADETAALRPLNFARFRRPSPRTLLVIAALAFAVVCALTVYKAIAARSALATSVSQATVSTSGDSRAEQAVAETPAAQPVRPAASHDQKHAAQAAKGIERLGGVAHSTSGETKANIPSRSATASPIQSKLGHPKDSNVPTGYSAWTMMHPAQNRLVPASEPSKPSVYSR